MNSTIFDDFDFSDFWLDDDYALANFRADSPSDALITSIEQELGYKFPAAYIEFMKRHNGGTPLKNTFIIHEPKNHSIGCIEIEGFLSISREKMYGLCGDIGSNFMIEEWGYPATGVYICNSPSGGHDMILLDYSNCDKNGEPEVVHIDQENNYEKTFLAKNFETFVRGLIVYEAENDPTEGLSTNEHTDLRTKALYFFRRLKRYLT